MGKTEGDRKSVDTLRVTKTTCLNSFCLPTPRPGQPHLCSRATRRSLSSLPRNPLAKGLFSIFSCVICQERTHSGVTGVGDWTALWPSPPAPGTDPTAGPGELHTPALGQPGVLPGPPCGSVLALIISTCRRPSDSVSCSVAPLCYLASVPPHCPLDAFNSFQSMSSPSSANATSGSKVTILDANLTVTLLPKICSSLWPFPYDTHPPCQSQCA